MEMRETTKIVSLASALAALVSPTAASPVAAAANSDGSRISTAEEKVRAEVEMSLPGDAELMSFTVHQTSDGMLFPQHGSHSSHSSHSSHVSHASSSPGIGLPDLPNPIYTPPTYAPPFVAPPVMPPPTQTTTSPPAGSSDPAYLACMRALNGFGVNQIASELQQIYGLTANEAVSIAQQALTSAFAGGHFCDPYIGYGQ